MIAFRRTKCSYTTNDCTYNSVKECAAVITSAYRVIITISEIVLIGESVAIRVDSYKGCAIGIDKPPYLRVIIPTSKIVQPRLRVVIVSPVANRVNARDATTL